MPRAVIAMFSDAMDCICEGGMDVKSGSICDCASITHASP